VVGEIGIKEDDQNQEKPVERNWKKLALTMIERNHVIRVGSLLIF